MMRKSLSLAGLCAVLLAFTPALAGDGRLDGLLAAEKAFADDGQATTARHAYLTYVADDGFNLANRPVTAEQLRALTSRSSPAQPAWPLLAGVSVDGNLGFVVGPIDFFQEAQGLYINIWRKDPGGWRYLLHGEDFSYRKPAGDPPDQPQAAAFGQPGPAEKAQGDMLAADAALNAAMEDKGPLALRKVMACDGVIHLTERMPLYGCPDLEAELRAWPRDVRYVQSRQGMAASGDLGWTYGSATWPGGGPGQYVRVWRHDAQGWRVVVDLLLKKSPMQ